MHRLGVQKHRWWRPLLWAGLLAFLLLLAWQAATSGALLAADPIVLSGSWHFVDESKPGSPMTAGALEAVAADAPTQVAARFDISSTMQALALQLSDAEVAGLPLAQVEELGYCTRLIDGPRPYAVTLQVNVDADVTDGDTSWQGRLVYTPSYNGAVIQGEWQCWNTLVGKWWATGGPVAAYAPEDSPQPLGTLLARFPNLGVNATYNGVALKAGDGWSHFQGEASPIMIGVEGERIDVAFGTAPQNSSPDDALTNEVLLPALMNNAQPAQTPQNENQDGKKPDKSNKSNKPDKSGKQEKKEEKAADKAEKADQKSDQKSDNVADWQVVDWDNINWEDIDWENFDWDKVDWAHLNWGTLGGGNSAHAEEIRAFVDDVKKCKNKGWDELGFSNAGQCVAYYAKAHTPLNLQWGDLNPGRNWNNGNHRGRSGND
jgi:hypothetical protein